MKARTEHEVRTWQRLQRERRRTTKGSMLKRGRARVLTGARCLRTEADARTHTHTHRATLCGKHSIDNERE